MNIQQVRSLEGMVPIHRWTKKKEWQHYKHTNRIMQNNKPQDESTQSQQRQMNRDSEDDEEY